MTEHDTRMVVDGAGEPWTVETAFAIPGRGRVLRYRHDMGYEITAMTAYPVGELTEPELIAILEDARHRTPRNGVTAAA